MWTTVWQRIALSDQNIVRSSAGSTKAGYLVKSDGTAAKILVATETSLETWLTLGTPSDYEVRATLNSGTTPVGTLGSWLALSTSREWSLTSVSGTLSCELLVEIRPTSGAVSDSANITLTSDKL